MPDLYAVTLSRAEHEALLEFLRETAGGEHHYAGPTLRDFDLRGAVRAIEAARPVRETLPIFGSGG